MSGWYQLVFLVLHLHSLVVTSSNSEGIRFLSENMGKEGVVTTESGIQYRVLKSGPPGGSPPGINDRVHVHYRGHLIDGTEFDSSFKRERPAKFTPAQVVKGWTEVLLLMHPGDEWEVVVPSNLAYGEQGVGDLIPPGSVLKFYIHLLEVELAGGAASFLVWFSCAVGLFVIVAVAWLHSRSDIDPRHAKLPRIPVEDASAMVENQKCFMKISINDEYVGKIGITLFSKVCPRTCDNFRSLCMGHRKLSFKGTPFHRIIPGFMIQGGDITNGDGTGGQSIFGTCFEDEFTSNGWVSHEKALLLSMANRGPDTNSSQFFITLGPTRWLDGKHVVFGIVNSGSDVVKRMASHGSEAGTVTADVSVADCGVA